jgi:nucleoside-diphosphate kinase
MSLADAVRAALPNGPAKERRGKQDTAGDRAVKGAGAGRRASRGLPRTTADGYIGALFRAVHGARRGRAPLPQPPTSAPMERTLVLLKPDAVQRGLVGPILTRFEQKGLRLIGLKMRRFALATIQEHYAVHRERPFYANLVAFMTSGPVVALALEGNAAVEVVRKLMGKTNSAQAEPGTIRGDYGMSFSNNLVHGSDSLESAKKELALFFPEASEICEWTPCDLTWVYSEKEELKRS